MSFGQDLMKTTWGRVLVGAVIAVGLLLGIRSIWNAVRRSDGAYQANERIFIDADSGKSFNYEVSPTTMLPVASPYSGKKTGYPAELCYWTRDGHIKSDPTPVLLNSYLHPGSDAPTFCPDCGRLVVPHNPKPRPGDRPPPTQEEYERMRRQFSASQ